MADVTLTILVKTLVPAEAPVSGVAVSIFNSTGATFVTSGVTDSEGLVEFTLDGSMSGVTYVARMSKLGFSFLPQPRFEVVATNPPSGDENEFEFICVEGLQGTLVTFSVQDDNEDPVSGADIYLFDEADLFLSHLQTNESGEVDIVLDGDEDPGMLYIVRLRPTDGYEVDTPTQTIRVLDPLGEDQTNVFEFEFRSLPDLPGSDDPDMCKVSGYFTDPSLRPIKNLTLIFHPREGYPDVTVSGSGFSAEPTVLRRNIIASERRVNTDKDGYIELSLPRESIFDVYVQGLDAADQTLLAPIYIPDLDRIALEDVLFPFVTEVNFDPTSSVAVSVGDTAVVSLDIVTSNLQPTTTGRAINSLLVFGTQDESIAIATIANDGTLQIQGVAAGTTQITVARKVGTFAPRRPAPPELVTDPVTLEVVVS